ncbi:hypothetical protein [Citrobacter sp. Cb004]|uniref:hypothetical protein n=1 Tax=Citrobacter sp. Cb004 TaxID=2985006 RepID=UPI002576DDB8|nr:hypothetical protein [Citrobacter sp. Cb004]MDM3354927.1 hypothetical protein [Citrobacter sp. Cb004]
MSEKVTHFVWCALVAVEIARSDGRVQTQEEERNFIMKWLQQAQKKRLFCREVAPVLLALQKLNNLYGVSISIREILNYYWQLDTGSLRKQTDFYRLHCALTFIKLPEAQKIFLPKHKQFMEIFIDNETLLRVFDDSGNLIMPLMIKVEFNISLIRLIFRKCSFYCAIHEEKKMIALSSGV